MAQRGGDGCPTLAVGTPSPRHRSRYLRTALSVLGTVLVTGARLDSQSFDERLSAVKTLKCEFTVMATGTWKDGASSAETRAATLTTMFDEIVVDEGTARAVGVFGPNDIIVRLSMGNLHLVQAFGEGPLYVTTIFPKVTRGTRLQAVHTRHEYTLISMPGYTSRPEQYYGECEMGK